MNTQTHPTAHFHITLAATGETEESLKERLNQAGLDITAVRAVSAIHDGISITQLLAQGEWDHATGAVNCNGSCKSEPEKRVPYAELSEPQKREFQRDMAQGMEYYRANLYDLSDSAFSDEFDNIATDRCSHCE